MLLEPETPLRRCAELDFGFLSVATPVGMHICYLQLKLSTGAADYVAPRLSCKTLSGYFKTTTVCRKRSLEPSLLVVFRSYNSSKRGFWLKLVPLVSSLNRKPRLEDVLSWTSDSLPMLLLLLRISATCNSSLVLVQLAL